MVYWLGKIIAGYIYAMVFFLLLRIFFRSVKARTVWFLRLANGIILIVLLLNLLTRIVEAIRCTGCYGVFYISFLGSTVLLAFLFQLRFFFSRYREKVGITAVSAALLLLYINFDSLMVLISRDWPMSYEHPDGPVAVGMAVIYFGVCWLWGGWKKR